MVTDFFTQEFAEFVKVLAIVFALMHFLIGFVLVRQVFRMNSIVKTRSAVYFSVLGLVYLLFLALILVWVILI